MKKRRIYADRESAAIEKEAKWMKLELLEYVPKESSNLPPLLFVHGGFHGAWCWEKNFLPYFFSKGFSCYALSLRGHGGSEGNEKLHSFSLNDYMEDVLDVMGRLKEKPVLIGHSMGGAVAQKIVHAYPDTLRMVILLASVPPQGMLKDFLRIYLTQRLGRLLFNRKTRLDLLLPLLFSNNLSIEEKNEFVKLLQPESRQATSDIRKRIVPVPTHSSWVGRPQVPMLVLGSKRDGFFPEKTVKSIGKAYKTQPIIFPDICHDMMLDPQWRKMADSIYTFLRETISAEESGRS